MASARLNFIQIAIFYPLKALSMLMIYSTSWNTRLSLNDNHKLRRTVCFSISMSALFLFPTTLLYKKYDECMSFHLIWNAIFGISAITLATVYLSDAQQDTNGCNTNCSSEWNSQICATNDEGKTKLFPSECVMKSENCLNKSSKFNAFLFRSYLYFYQINCVFILLLLFFKRRIRQNWSSWRWFMPVI